jgi:hypothetical protein
VNHERSYSLMDSQDRLAGRQAYSQARWRRLVSQVGRGIACSVVLASLVGCTAFKRAYVYVWTTCVTPMEKLYEQPQRENVEHDAPDRLPR